MCVACWKNIVILLAIMIYTNNDGDTRRWMESAMSSLLYQESNNNDHTKSSLCLRVEAITSSLQTIGLRIIKDASQIVMFIDLLLYTVFISWKVCSPLKQELSHLDDARVIYY